MREDMGKVLVERPRLGRWRGDSRPGKGTQKQLRKNLLTWDSVPTSEGMKRTHARRPKTFNEHLGPLRRFLAANVGRPWDAVYSEICRHVDRGNVVQKHVLTHLFDYVVTGAVLIDGQPCHGPGRRYGEPLRASHRLYQWYVCPKTGLLRASRHVPRGRQRRPERTPRVVRLNNRSACIDRGGHWELVEVRRVSHPTPSEVPAYEALLKRLIDSRGRDEEWTEEVGRTRYELSRRALTRTELRGFPIPVEWLK